MKLRPEWLVDDELRGRAETIALCSSMVGLGAGLGIIWSYAALVKAGPMIPPDWVADATAQLEMMLFVAGGVLALGTAVMLALMVTDEDFDATTDSDSSDDIAGDEGETAKTDGGVVEAGSDDANPGGSVDETTLQNRLRDR